MLFRGAVESADGLVSSCGNHTDIRSIVPNAPRPTSQMPHHFIIVDTGVVFPLSNSRLYHVQRNANIPVSSATTLMCSSSWSMEDLIKSLMWQPCLHVHCLLPTAFALYIWLYPCRQIRFNSQLDRDTSLLLLSWLIQLNIPTRSVLHCPYEVAPNVSEVLLLLASMDDDDDTFPVLLVPVARFAW